VTTFSKRNWISLTGTDYHVCINFVFKKLFHWTALKSNCRGKRIDGIKIKNFILFDAKQQVNALLNVNTVLKWLFALLIYTALPILFGFFHGLKALPLLFGYILNPLKKMGLVLELLPDLITILVIIFVFRYVLKGFTTSNVKLKRKFRITAFIQIGQTPLTRSYVYCFLLLC
jgi:hypothetical protein